MMLFWLSEVNFPWTGGGFPVCGTFGQERVENQKEYWTLKQKETEQKSLALEQRQDAFQESKHKKRRKLKK